jgi:transketolase
MRNAFADELTKLAVEDSRIVLLSGDIGNRLFDKFKEQCSSRFFNCGVSEANIIGMAAGLASSGYRPVVYTITPFITYRCYEQIRVDICYHHQPVTIVGVGSGMGYSSLGATHHSCEDIAVMRVLPHMTVVCPGDPFEVRGAVQSISKNEGPTYIRLGKKGEPTIHPKPPTFKIGKGIVVKAGSDICVLSNGTMLPEAKKVTELIEQRGMSTSLVSLHTVKPLDDELLQSLFQGHKLVVLLEEHSRIGGVGSALLEWMHDRSVCTPFLRFGTPDDFFHEAGERENAFELWELLPEQVVSKIFDKIRLGETA